MFSKSQQMTHQFKQLFTCDNEISFDWGFFKKRKKKKTSFAFKCKEAVERNN